MSAVIFNCCSDVANIFSDSAYVMLNGSNSNSEQIHFVISKGRIVGEEDTLSIEGNILLIRMQCQFEIRL